MSETKHNPARDWSEDFADENGNYMNTCHSCQKVFFGYKRRVTCKLCAPPRPETVEVPVLPDESMLAAGRKAMLSYQSALEVWVAMLMARPAGLSARPTAAETGVEIALTRIADLINPHWRGAGLKLAEPWLFNDIVALAHDANEPDQQDFTSLRAQVAELTAERDAQRLADREAGWADGQRHYDPIVAAYAKRITETEAELETLADEIEDTEEHGGGADDANCRICASLARARALLADVAQPEGGA